MQQPLVPLGIPNALPKSQSFFMAASRSLMAANSALMPAYLSPRYGLLVKPNIIAIASTNCNALKHSGFFSMATAHNKTLQRTYRKVHLFSGFHGQLQQQWTVGLLAMSSVSKQELLVSSQGL